MFMSAHSGEGTSSVAVSFGLLASRTARKPVWLIDLDLQNNPLIEALKGKFASDVGKPGRPYDASLGKMTFFDISEPGHTVTKPSLRSGKLLAAHQIYGTRLLVTRFRNEHLASGQTVRLVARDDWWQALRRSADWVIVDSPSPEVSRAGLDLASLMDGVIIVVGADRTGPEEITRLKQDIETAGGHVLGVVMNRVQKDSLFVDRLAG